MTEFTDRTADAQAIIQAAREHAAPAPIDPTEDRWHAFIRPAGAVLDLVKPDEALLDRPRRLKGTVGVEDVESFAAYVGEFYDAERTTAWVDLTRFQVTAVLNDATADESAWRDHRAVLELVKTDEWKRWRGKDGVLMGQEDFARHIELGELDIVSPDAAELLEIAQTFYASTKAEFRSGTRLQNGEVQLTWVEETNATAGRNGDLNIPSKFELRIAPFHGEEPCALSALLRYRIRDGKLSIGYELVRPDDVERDAMRLIAEQLKANITRVYTGSPA